MEYPVEPEDDAGLPGVFLPEDDDLFFDDELLSSPPIIGVWFEELPGIISPLNVLPPPEDDEEVTEEDDFGCDDEPPGGL